MNAALHLINELAALIHSAMCSEARSLLGTTRGGLLYWIKLATHFHVTALQSYLSESRNAMSERLVLGSKASAVADFSTYEGKMSRTYNAMRVPPNMDAREVLMITALLNGAPTQLPGVNSMVQQIVQGQVKVPSFSAAMAVARSA